MSGRPLPQRLRLGPVELDRYLAGQLQGLAYMRRLRAIEDEEARHLRELEEAWRALAEVERPMNPRTGTYAQQWQRGEYTGDWILERFPPSLRRALALRAAT